MAFSLFAMFVLALFVLYRIFRKYIDNYWSDRGFSSSSPSTIKQWSKSQPISHSNTECSTYAYFKATGCPLGGTFEAWSPQLYVTDVILCRKIMVEDSDHFVDRRILYEPQINPLFGKMLSFSKGEEWKRLRSIVSLAFTPSRLKDIYPQFISKCQQLITTIKDSHGRVNVHEIVGRFTMDVISATAFGIEAGTLLDPKAVFYQKGTKVQRLTLRLVFARVLAKWLPKIAKFLRLSTFDTSALEFFANATKAVVRAREESVNSENLRKDLLQILLANESMTHDEIVSQAVLFYILGFDTMNTLLGICCVLLAKYPEIQQKLFQEINLRCNEKCDNLSYDSLNEFPYMDKVIAETLRLYPPSTRTERTCTKEYNVPGTNLVIPKHSQIVIPIYAFQIDSDYWENPLDFDPERSTTKNAHFPFGVGPRSCLGSRFALTLSKVFLVYVLLSYKIELHESIAAEDIDNIIQHQVGTVKVKEGTFLNFITRRNKHPTI